MKIKLYAIFNDNDQGKEFTSALIKPINITTPNVESMAKRIGVIGCFSAEEYVSYFGENCFNYIVYFEKDIKEVFVEPDEPDFDTFPPSSIYDENALYDIANKSYTENVLYSFYDLGFICASENIKDTLYGTCVKDIKANEIYCIKKYFVGDGGEFDPRTLNFEMLYPRNSKFTECIKNILS